MKVKIRMVDWSLEGVRVLCDGRQENVPCGILYDPDDCPLRSAEFANDVSCGQTIDISDEFFAEYKNIMDGFRTMQEKLLGLI